MAYVALMFIIILALAGANVYQWMNNRNLKLEIKKLNERLNHE